MTAGTLRRSKAWLRQLYEGGSPAAHQFRYALLAFDLVTLLFIVVTSFLPRSPLVEVLALSHQMADAMQAFFGSLDRSIIGEFRYLADFNNQLTRHHWLERSNNLVPASSGSK